MKGPWKTGGDRRAKRFDGGRREKACTKATLLVFPPWVSCVARGDGEEKAIACLLQFGS